ncbi:MAG: hypothetical protein IJ521_11040 [Schwartzia sp.]|nr:hypothetical protein [Schwartzia sp. (in: firmicutes)]
MDKKITSLEWIVLYEAFERFEAEAKAHGLYVDELQRIGDDLFARCPIPQPQPMKV